MMLATAFKKKTKVQEDSNLNTESFRTKDEDLVVILKDKLEAQKSFRDATIKSIKKLELDLTTKMVNLKTFNAVIDSLETELKKIEG